MMTTADIRTSFLQYFQKRGHTTVPSSPVVPHNDPTLLFTNAGMNQFKDIFTGKERSPYPRAVSSQKCIRAGGKHNDLDNVGFTARHHTFFEMLGNFSFGDYFKKEAIEFAWEWITRELRLPVERLYVSVYETDDEAALLWEKIASGLPAGRILRFGKKDNFWAMGETGPCGPCSEIHFDRGEKYGTGTEARVNGESDRFMEIWNLVFMQFETLPSGEQVPLPRPSVDTGAGLERLASVIQGTDSNYGIDLFRDLVAAIAADASVSYKEQPASFHVVADHLRAVSFAIADGAGISNEGRGYVLRRILRRAIRHGRLIGFTEPFMYRLVPALETAMGAAYPELREKRKQISEIIRTEEEAFGRTLENGLELFAGLRKKAEASGVKAISGLDVFRLYDTYGFPYDLTEILAAENSLSLDRDGFDRAMQEQRVKSRDASQFSAKGGQLSQSIQAVLRDMDIKVSPTEFVRDRFSLESAVQWGKEFIHEGSCYGLLITEQTPFYLEAGGQVSDSGTISGDGWEMTVLWLSAIEGGYVHAGPLNGSMTSLIRRSKVRLAIDEPRRWAIMRNHTATHLLHAALRRILGKHVKQAGSYVGPDRLRFDFSHTAPISTDEVRRIEQTVNEQIIHGTAVTTQVMDLDAAKQTGAMALFGEKYGERVRVVGIDSYSTELCGGTHVTTTGQIGPFVITLETGVASGVRRIEAVTGSAGIEYLADAKSFRMDVADAVGRPVAEALPGVLALKEQIAGLQKDLKKVRDELVSGGGVTSQEESLGGVTFVHHDFGDSDREMISAWIDTQRARAAVICAIGTGQVGGKLVVIAGMSDRAVGTEQCDAGKLLAELLPPMGGKGGGKAQFAQGSLGDVTLAEKLMDAVRTYLTRKGTRALER